MVIINVLLAEADHVFEVVCLGCVLALIHIAVIYHERTIGAALECRSKVELLRTLLNTSSLAIVVSASALLEIYQVTRRKVHILHISALALVSNVGRRNLKILSRYLTLENQLGVLYIRVTIAGRLVALELRASLWLLSLDRVCGVALCIDQGQLLLVCQRIC